jgi:hypothetical protein
MARPLSDLVQRLSLSDEEALAIFALAPLEAIGGDVGHRPEVAILDAITAEADETLGEGALARWLRAGRPGERPLDLLLAGDFRTFEDALAQRVAAVA